MIERSVILVHKGVDFLPLIPQGKAVCVFSISGPKKEKTPEIKILKNKLRMF